MNNINDLKNISDRIEYAINFYKKKNNQKLTWASLAKAIGLTPQAPTNWKKDKVSKDTLEQISNFTGVDYYWLLTGKGHPTPKPAQAIGMIGTTTIATSFGGPILGLATAGLSYFLKALKDNSEKKFISKLNISEKIEVSIIPVYTQNQLVNFKETVLDENNEVIPTTLSKISDYSFSYKIEDKSMEPVFQIDDHIIIDPQKLPQTNDYVLALNGKTNVVLGKYVIGSHTSEQQPVFNIEVLNQNFPSYSSIENDLIILGTVVEHQRKLN